MQINDAWLDGVRVNLTVERGVITALTTGPAPTSGRPPDALEGGVLCPPLAEPHCHLDAALLGRRAPNRSGTLVEGIRNWSALREGLTHDDVRERALETLRWYASWGCTRVRTHVDTGSLVAAEALIALRDEVARGLPGLTRVDPLTGEAMPVPIELQIVAFPQEGILRAPGRREAWETIASLGCDAVGAIPHFERTTEEGWRSVRLAFDLAERLGAAVDLHCDETDDPGSRNLEVVCAEAIDRDMGEHVIAGHCTAMHSYPDPYAAKVAALVAEARVQVVANPLDNIVLQGRYSGYPRRRGLTRVDELWAAGATVGIGHDSVMDPWYPLGTANLVDAASMLVHAGHLTGLDQMDRVFRTLSRENHRAFGSTPELAVGQPADLCWYPAHDALDVLRTRPRPRVFVGGLELKRA